MIALLLGALLLQGEPPTLDASVDQDRVMVGEEITYRLRATSRSPAPMEVTVAPFTGLETVSRSERTELSLGAFVFLGDRASKFGDPAAGASELFLKAKFTY